MNEILTGYDVNSATWFYLSLLLILAVYFRFNRVFSLRNLDLVLLLAMSPPLLLVSADSRAGYTVLFVVTGLVLLRVWCDPLFVRRPRLEQNLNVAGLTFLCVAAFAFLMTIAYTKPPPANTLETVRRGQNLLNREDASATPAAPKSTAVTSSEPGAGPASSIVAATTGAISKAVAPDDRNSAQAELRVELLAARIMAILAHSAVILALLWIGYRHFGDIQSGVAMATLYLLLPCTSYDVHKVNHVLPAALIIWAIAAYRRPIVAGGLMGWACGALFFPVFLLPLWVAFYGKRGAVRFLSAFVAVAALLVGSLALTSADLHSFTEKTFGSIEWEVLKLTDQEAAGFWSKYPAAYGIPVFAAYVVMLVMLTIWPRKKNVEHLLAHSAALVIGTQFWYPQQGGVYLLWYLPLLLLVVFRPQLTNLVPPDSAQTLPEPKELRVRPREPATSGSGVGGQFFR